MRLIYKYIFIFTLLSFPNIGSSATINDNFKGTWNGIEIVGVDVLTAEKIRKEMPFKIGDSFQITDDEKYLETCQKYVGEIIPSANAKCNFIYFADGKVYLNIELPNNVNVEFRKIPIKKGKLSSIPKAAITLYRSWDDRMSYLLSSGSFPREKYNEGFRDSEDPILHDLAIKMSKTVWKYNDILLDVIHYSQNVEERRDAAALLAWARHPENLYNILEWDLLMDPDIGVRNYISRNFMYYISDANDTLLLKKLLPIYCKQAALPNHTDRNKALYSILGILNADKNLSSNISSECNKTITYISERSILENVGGPAKQIKKMMERAKNA